MASLYRRKGSPCWWVQFIDANGRRVNQSTGFRSDDPEQTRSARKLRAELEARELENPVANPKCEDGWQWVDSFIHNAFKVETTRRRYLSTWRWVMLFLQRHALTHPSMIRYKHGAEYVAWRTAWVKKSGKSVGTNTALMETKVWSRIMGEAARRGLCELNPIQRLGIAEDPAREKPELTDAEIARCRSALASEPEWMRTSFEISLNTGCRLRETAVPLSCVDFIRKTITFPAPKGGRSKAFTIPLPDALVPLFEDLRRRKVVVAVEFPFAPSRQWQHFFRRAEVPHLTFHCLRVTYITRLARAAVPLSVAMRLVNHASETVHRIYQRLQVEDVRQWANAVTFGGAAAATEQSHPKKRRGSSKAEIPPDAPKP